MQEKKKQLFSINSIMDWFISQFIRMGKSQKQATRNNKTTMKFKM